METCNFFAVDEKGNKYNFDVKQQGSSLFLTLPVEKFCNATDLWVLPELFNANVGDKGYYVIPGNIRQKGDIITYFKDREEDCFVQRMMLMSFYAMITPNETIMVRVDRNYHYGVQIKLKDGVYSACLYYNFTDKAENNMLSSDNVTVCDFSHDDIRLEIITLPKGSDYNDVATLEREIRLKRGEIITLAEKCKREAVEYARKYPLVRIRMGWKPSPSPIKSQTVENEPKMHVACTFEQVRNFANQLKKSGVEGVELQLVGWNKSGHDGRFPQLFPADERLGGNDEFLKTINYVKSLGYRISTHTNNIDSYEIADTFTFSDAVISKNGKPLQIGDYSGGYSYHVCPQKQLKNAKRDLPELAEYGENGLHFTDVVSIVLPDNCFSKFHPITTETAIMYVQNMMDYTQTLFGGFSSEGCMDFAIKYLDYGLYVNFGDAFGAIRPPFADEFLPIWEIAYHGVVLYNPVSRTVNYPIKSKEDRLTFIMYGGKPSLYLYSKFREGKEVNWMGVTDLTIDNDKEVTNAVNAIKTSVIDYEPFKDKQLLFITNYYKLENGIEVAKYSDGSKIVGNFTDEEVVYEGKKIEAYDYILM